MQTGEEATPMLISVMMPVHNGENTLHRAIGSVVAQTYTNWELVTIDDCSTDTSHGFLQEWTSKDQRIRVFRTPTNQGPAAARNLGLEQARGGFIAYLDCDDEFYPDY